MVSRGKERWPAAFCSLALGLLVTAGVGWFAAREFDWRAVRASLAAADPRHLALAVAAMLLNIALKTLRWQWLLRPTPRPLLFRDALAALMVGQLGNTLLPARLGDAARVGVVHRKAGVPLSLALWTLLAEKACDGVLLGLVLGALLPVAAWQNWLGTTELALSALLVAGLLCLTWLATQERARQRVVQAMERLPLRPLPRMMDDALQSLGAWRAVQDWRAQVRLWAVTVAIWLLSGWVNQCGFHAVGLELPFSAGMLLAGTEIAGTRLAYTPAALGVYHSVAVLTLALYGVGAGEALGAAVLLHGVVYVPILVGGVAAAWSEGLSGREEGVN